MTDTPRGWWPTEEEAKARLENSDWSQLTDGTWLSPGGVGHSESAAVAIVSVRMALGQDENLTDVLTSELFAALVQRVVDLEAAHGYPR